MRDFDFIPASWKSLEEFAAATVVEMIDIVERCFKEKKRCFKIETPSAEVTNQLNGILRAELEAASLKHYTLTTDGAQGLVCTIELA